MSEQPSGTYWKIEPVPGPEAFEERSADARLSQAAFVLSAAAGVAGEPRRVESSERFPLPQLNLLTIRRKFSVAQAVKQVDVDTAEYVAGFAGVIPSSEGARLARQLFDNPQPQTAAALVEVSLHSPSRIVRTAAAAAALDTTGPREEIVALLADSTRSDDETIHSLARVALARLRPDHEAVAKLAIRRPQIRTTGRRSHTTALTHGTFSSRARWWRPNGSFYAYLNGLRPSLHVHHQSFQWSGAYSAAERDLAADDLVDWAAAEGLVLPDLFAHSHGVTVANLATQRGLKVTRLVMLSWPVHDAWLPDLGNVKRVIDIRVRFDLVIMADRGGQRLPAATRNVAGVSEHIHGWFKHGFAHDPQYWERYDIQKELPPPPPAI